MAILDIHTHENQSVLTAADAAAQVFVLAFKALSVDALLTAIRSDRFTLPPDSPDSVDLLREDRSR